MDNKTENDDQNIKKKEKLKNKIIEKKHQIKELITNIYHGEKTFSKIQTKSINFVKVFIVATRRFLLDDCLTKASSTAYTIIISFIPTLTVVLTFYSIFSGVGGKKDELFRKISVFMVEHNMKINLDVMFSAISGLVDNAAKIGGIGAVIMIFSATAMLRSLEKSLNGIFRVKTPRPIIMKIIFYWAALTLGPAMLIAGTTVATKVTEFFSSPDYQSIYITEKNNTWVVGNKANVLYSSGDNLNFKKINIERIDFDNQRFYKYNKMDKSFTLKEERIEPLEFKGTKFRDIQFIGEKGWAVGKNGIIIETGNSGKSWVLKKWGNYNFNDIHMVSNETGFIAADDGAVLKTGDGGGSWEVMEWDDVTANFKSINFNKKTGIITGSGGTILYTTDSGEKWELKKLDETKKKGRHFDLNSTFFINSRSIIITASDGYILMSSDSGKSWKVKKFKTYDYNTAYFFDAKKGFVAGSKGMVIYTEDGGWNWKITKLPTDSVNKLIYRDKLLYAAGSTGMLMISRDNGKTWTGKEGKSLLAVLLNFLAPFAFIWILFAFIYIGIPNTKVPFKAASLGAAFTGTVWVIFILLFIFYTKLFAKGTFAVYGALASIPLFLLMIYSSTVIILYGAEVSYTLMHPETYINLKRTLRDRKEIHVYYGISILHYIYKKFEGGNGATSEKELKILTANESDNIEFFIDLFEKNKLIIKNDDTNYIPSNSSENIKIARVVNAVHNVSLKIPVSAKSSAGLKNLTKQMFADISRCREEIIGDLTLKTLINKC